MQTFFFWSNLFLSLFCLFVCVCCYFQQTKHRVFREVIFFVYKLTILKYWTCLWILKRSVSILYFLLTVDLKIRKKNINNCFLKAISLMHSEKNPIHMVWCYLSNLLLKLLPLTLCFQIIFQFEHFCVFLLALCTRNYTVFPNLEK